MMTNPTYAIGDLAELGGITRRTVRYYVQEGLIPPPLGRGRGRHYTESHLERLLEVKALQEKGLSLEAIRTHFQARSEPPVQYLAVDNAPAASASMDYSPPTPESSAAPLATSRSSWTRIEIAPGLELHVSSDWRIPPPGRLARLAESCRRLFTPASGASS
jgi:DNA-binding transcriptional MerR regulator